MNIRRAELKDIPGINNLLRQVLMVHHNGRPDLFKAGAKKYTDEQLAELIQDDTKPIFVCVDETRRGQHIGKSLYEYVLAYAKENDFYNVTLNVWSLNESAMKFYEACGLKPQKVGMETIL
jgi:ribosomal protein S18 acetylase RimI-like enzyme